MGKFQVNFERSSGEIIPIGAFEDKAESVKDFAGDIPCFHMIRDYILELNPNYTIHYIRSFMEDESTLTIDVGSHTEFFHVIKI